ncbi:MAG: hypothetical protein GWP19_05260 [Planctomycetia bacterium]|nr:hypothetical protein [Planctomycetia bacterium]
MKKLFVILIIITGLMTFVNAQGITNTLGGNTANNKFIIENSDSKTGLTVTGEGKVGIGTTNPYQKLEILSSDDTKDAAMRFLNDTGTILDIGVSGSDGGSGAGNDNPYMYTNNRDLIILSGTGNVGINTVNPQEKLDIVGTIRTTILEITGGSDLAEPFDIVSSEEIKPGMLVAIDSKRPGQLQIADSAYDRTVAGIVSGANGINPGMTMTQKGIVTDGALPVALTGRVYAWVDASNGPIKPGDLLTTSNTPGHAMKVDDYVKAQGAIIGKAMSALKQGKGLVLVLVSLQ